MKPKLQKAAAICLLLVGKLSLASPLGLAPLTTPSNSSIAGLDVSLLMSRSGCDQSDCPDTRFNVDIWSQYMVGMRTWVYLLRWQSVCGCHREQVWEDGCKTFTTCTGQHSVCFDWHGGRAHWIDAKGHKICWYLSSDYPCKNSWSVWPKVRVPCTW